MDHLRPGGFKVLPDVVKNLLIINVLFYLAKVVFEEKFGILLVDTLGLHFPSSPDFRPYQFLTYMFMHGNFMHILFNMLAVWMFGSVLENYWGGKKFLFYYIVTGIGASVIHYIWMYYADLKPALDFIDYYIQNPSEESLISFLRSDTMIADTEIALKRAAFIEKYDHLSRVDKQLALDLSRAYMLDYRKDLLNAPVVVGASGALFGILLAFGMLFPNTLIYLYFAIPIKAKYFVAIYGLIELISGITNPNSNVAHFAHLGGMVFGFILIKMWERKRRDYDYYE